MGEYHSSPAEISAEISIVELAVGDSATDMAWWSRPATASDTRDDARWTGAPRVLVLEPDELQSLAV